MSKEKKRVIIVGAAGRDFHNFNVFFRNNPEYEVVCFTAAQLPDVIAGRMYPPELAGPQYPNGIPIYKEEQLPELIEKYNVDYVVFSYSDVSHHYVMERAAIAASKGASYILLGPKHTMLKSNKPVIAIGAVRTGAGKSTVSRKVARILAERGLKVVAVRHPMPYGDLRKQIVQRFASYDDLDKYDVTFEEREEYEHYIDNGFVVYAGVDYEKILKEAEKEADVIIWDGGNNDYPFYVPDLFIVVADALRPGHELTYWPGSVNIRMADVVIINKVVEGDMKSALTVMENIRKVNKKALILYGASVLRVDNPADIEGKKVLVVEDGPTVTHGEMSFGAGYVAAIMYGAKEIVDPRKWVKPGTDLADAYEKYKHMGKVLPTLGYSDREKKEVEEVINASDADVVVSGTPIDLSRVLKVNKPIVRVWYELEEFGKKKLEEIIDCFLQEKGLK